MDIIPAFDKIIIERNFQKIALGQAVSLICSIQDITTTPGQHFQFDPSVTPQIEIFNPDNTIKVGFSNMTFISTGVYGYEHQTLYSDQIGMYTARFKAVDGTKTGITNKRVVFQTIFSIVF
jgi:hypothetical protein